MSSNKHFGGDLEITKSEFENIEKALKNDEFKKLFFDYCQEIQDPVNRKQYESEITQLEAERGVEVTFLQPQPGFVIKTSVDGKSKGFINISQCEKIAPPANDVRVNAETGRKGLNWSLPYAQAPPRHDVDNKGARCLVYDVLFHPDALHLAEKNAALRQHLIATACDAVEREFAVQLDRSNLKFPKLKFKGVARPTVIRKKVSDGTVEPSPIDAIYPPMPEAREIKTVTTQSRQADEYATPKFVIKHRRGVDLAEMTYELDAKLNVTLPKELVIAIELPLLKSTADCVLDVTEKQLLLVSEKPAKYRLRLDLPYIVDDKSGTAKFDTATRMLNVVLPVSDSLRERKLRDLYREDSGVESDVRDDVFSTSNPDSSMEDKSRRMVEVLDSFENGDGKADGGNNSNGIPQPFLKSNIHYNFPLNFDCNILDEELAIVLHVKNVDPQSVAIEQKDASVHIKFTSIGSGYYPTNYAFYFGITDSKSKIISAEAEAWDNNVILNLSLADVAHLRSYLAGLDEDHVREYSACNKIAMPQRKMIEQENNVEVSIDRSNDGKSVEIEVKPVPETESDHKEKQDTVKNKASKKQKKKNKKRRSLSESSCDDLKAAAAAESEQQVAEDKNSDSSPDRNSSDDVQTTPGRKQRSYSECRDSGAPHFKGILKRHSRYDRTISESCSSIDDPSSYSCSIDVMRIAADSISDIPEENSPSQDGLSESCKKTVRFSEVIQKQLFRLHSSILGQRKKNQKRKNQKQKARQRRSSEGDSADYEDNNKSPRGTNQFMNKNQSDMAQHDSGLDLSIQNTNGTSRNRIDSESSDIGSKNSLMFELEM